MCVDVLAFQHSPLISVSIFSLLSLLCFHDQRVECAVPLPPGNVTLECGHACLCRFSYVNVWFSFSF